MIDHENITILTFALILSPGQPTTALNTQGRLWCVLLIKDNWKEANAAVLRKQLDATHQ